MKINRLIALLACTMAFTACQDDMQEASMQQNKIYTLTGKMSGGNTMSRAQIALGNTTSGSGETAYWNEGDEFTLYQCNEEDNWREYVFSISDEYDESEKNPSVTFSTQYPANSGNYVAVYPAYRTVFGDYVTCEISNYTSYNFVDQNLAEGWKDYFKKNMFMLAQGTLSEDGINDVSFNHLTSLFRISYTNASEELQIVKGISLGGDQHFRLSNRYSLENGEIVEEGRVTNDYIVWYDGITVEPGDTTDFYIFFFPTVFDVGDLDISFILGRGEYDERKTVEIPMAYIAEKSNTEGFKAGKRYWFHLTDNGKYFYLDKDFTTDEVKIENPELSKVLQEVLQYQNISVDIDEETGYATLSQMDANSVKELYLGDNDFTSLKGLEHFKNLKILNVENCKLQDTLEISAFTRLEQLYVGGNTSVKEIVFPETNTLWLLNIANMNHWATTQKIEEVGGILPQLKSLNVSSNGLTALDLSTFSNLEELLCYNNDLLVLDLSDRPEFRIVDCSNNKELASLNLSECTSLDKVAVDGCTSLSSLSISNPERLQILLYSDTQVTLTKEDLETFTSVTRLGCAGRFNGSLDIPEAMKGRLVYLDCHNNQLITLNLVEYPNLQSLLCYENQLTSLDVDSVKNLEDLYCYRNRIDALDVSSLEKLRNLECGLQDSDNGVLILKTNENQKQQWNEYWKQFDTNQEVSLEEEFSTKKILFTNKQFAAALYNVLGSNKVTLNPVDSTAVILEGHVLSTTVLNFGDKNLTVASFDGIEEFKNLESLICNNIGLTTLDVSALTGLKELYCPDNSLKELEVSENTSLEFLYCGWNKLTELDVTKNVNLTTLGCHSNEISVLDVSNNVLLESLGCSDNNLTELIVTNNVDLWTLGCSGNELSVLDLSCNTKLQDLYCYNNRINALDITNNSVLKTLECGGQKDIKKIVVTMTNSQFSTWESTWSTGNNNDSTIEAKVITE